MCGKSDNCRWCPRKCFPSETVVPISDGTCLSAFGCTHTRVLNMLAVHLCVSVRVTHVLDRSRGGLVGGRAAQMRNARALPFGVKYVIYVQYCFRTNLRVAFVRVSVYRMWRIGIY